MYSDEITLAKMHIVKANNCADIAYEAVIAADAENLTYPGTANARKVELSNEKAKAAASAGFINLASAVALILLAQIEKEGII